MKLRKSHIPWLVFLVLLVVLGARLAVVASRAETGRETVADACCNATIVFRRPKSLWYGSEMSPEQVAFWLAEIDRITAEHPDSAELAMGAACLADHLEGLCPSGSPHEEACRSRRRELAERATRLEPENVDWWRMRAMLETYSDYYPFYHVEPPSHGPEWFDMLEECARHDPDNALYDYIAAVHLYATSTNLDVNDHVVVKNPIGYELAGERFAAAQKKEFFTVGRPDLPALAALLRHSVVPYAHQGDIAVISYLSSYEQRLLLAICTYQSMPTVVDSRDDASRLVALVRNRLRVLEQLDWDGESISSHYSWLLHPIGAIDLETLAADYPEVISGAEAERLVQRIETWQVNAMALATAFEEVGGLEELLATVYHVIPAFCVQAALRLAALLAAAGLLVWAVARWMLRKQPAPERLGVVRHLAAWTGAFALGFFVFGIGPAEQTPSATLACASVLVFWPVGFFLLFRVYRATVRLFRRWGAHPDRVPAIATIWLVMLWQITLAGVLITSTYFIAWVKECYDKVPGFLDVAAPICITVGMAVLLVWVYFVRERTKRSPVPHIVAACLLALAAFVVAAPWVVYAMDPMDPWLPPIRNRESIWWLLCQQWLYGQESPWRIAFAQWVLYYGAYTSVGLSFLLVAAWYVVRCTKSAGEGFRQCWFVRPCRGWGRLLDCLGRSAIGAGGAFLLIALLVGPVAVRSVERDYQTKMSYAGNPEKQWDKVRAILPGIKEKLKKEIEEEKRMQEETEKELERWESQET